MATILIVDDSSSVQQMLGTIVRNAGHQPVFASDGKSSITTAEEHMPALIFMDVVMPVQDGFSACRALKNNPSTANIPVVLVTSKVGASDKFWGRKQGADDHIDKPFTNEAVAAVIQRYVR
jgi:twitching motility two-component system response regulator PilH